MITRFRQRSPSVTPSPKGRELVLLSQRKAKHLCRTSSASLMEGEDAFLSLVMQAANCQPMEAMSPPLTSSASSLLNKRELSLSGSLPDELIEALLNRSVTFICSLFQRLTHPTFISTAPRLRDSQSNSWPKPKKGRRHTVKSGKTPNRRR